MATTVDPPPKPDRAPDVHLRAKAQTSRKKSRTLKGDLRFLRERAASFGNRWSENRVKTEEKKTEVRKEADRILAPAREKFSTGRRPEGDITRPARPEPESAGRSTESGSRRTRPYVTSFGMSLILAWVVNPQQFLTAVYERARFHTGTTSWGIMHGPGRWFRDTLSTARETGQTAGLVGAIILGLAPMIILTIRNMSATHLAGSVGPGRAAALTVRWITRAAYLVPILFFVGISYPGIVTPLFGSPWEMHWWQLYVAGLFFTAYYFTTWVFDRMAKKLGPDYTHVLLMIPLASIISGALLDTPNALW